MHLLYLILYALVIFFIKGTLLFGWELFGCLVTRGQRLPGWGSNPEASDSQPDAMAT